MKTGKGWWRNGAGGRRLGHWRSRLAWMRVLGAGLPLLAVRASPPAAPPPAPPWLVREVRAVPPSRPAAPAANPVWSIGEPSDEEQLLLELINRARANPAAEASRLRSTSDPQLLQTYAYFQVDLDRFAADLGALPPRPPLAFHSLLFGPARSHSQYQLANAVQTHYQGNETVLQRVEAAGYPWQALGENIYAYAEDPFQAHAGFEVDWGLFGPDGLPVAPGLQDPPGHRLSNHGDMFREVGIGWLAGRNTVATPTSTNSVGPHVVTVVFAARPAAPPLVTGVAYFDLNTNGFYDLGEGVGGIEIEVAGASWSGRTSRSGGYAVPVALGHWTATFRGPGLAPVTRPVAVDGDANAKLDLVLAYAPPSLAGPSQVLAGITAEYVVSPVPGATELEWERSRRTAFNAVLGAETGQADAVSVQVSGYPALQTLLRYRGAAAYRLATPAPEDQVITLAATFLGGPSSRLRFASQLGIASPDQQAVVELSTDGGVRWRPVWSRHGTGVPGETVFTLQDVPLAGVDGQPFRLRFRYAPGASYYPQTDPGVGWYLDDVTLSGVSQLQETTLGLQPATGRVEMAFPGVGEWVLRVRPRVEGRPLPFGPLLLAAAAPNTGTPPVVRIRRTSREPDGQLRLVFGLDSGQAALFRLDAAPAPGGPWTERPLASPTLVAGEGAFLVPTDAAAAVFRVRVP